MVNHIWSKSQMTSSGLLVQQPGTVPHVQVKPQVSRLTLTSLLQAEKKLWLSVWSESVAEIWAIFHFLKEAKVRHNRVPPVKKLHMWCKQVRSLEWSDQLALMSRPSQGCMQYICNHTYDYITQPLKFKVGMNSRTHWIWSVLGCASHEHYDMKKVIFLRHQRLLMFTKWTSINHVFSLMSTIVITIIWISLHNRQGTEMLEAIERPGWNGGFHRCPALLGGAFRGWSHSLEVEWVSKGRKKTSVEERHE